MVRQRKLDWRTVLVASILIAAIMGTLGYIWVSNDVIARINFQIAQASRSISRGTYYSNITFSLNVTVSSSDPVFPINMTRPFFVLTVEPPFYFFGDATPQFHPRTPRQQLDYSLTFTRSMDPTATDYLMNRTSNSVDLEMYALASAGFSQLQIFRDNCGVLGMTLTKCG